jgi:glutamate racemase
MTKAGPIGIFDSGIGGLTVFKTIKESLPQYDYLYLGDNARVPYGTRSFETVYHYTRECIVHMQKMGCRLIIIACNTASAKALRTIQQRDLPLLPDTHRVLGVIRPTTEMVGTLTRTGHVGILATQGTVSSQSYVIEIGKFFPSVQVFQQACPMWVPLVENNEHTSPGADYFVKKYIRALTSQSTSIDTVVLGCTHYPLLLPKIRAELPAHVKIISQDHIVAERLKDYLLRHPEIADLCSRGGRRDYYTTESTVEFDRKAVMFLDEAVTSRHLQL